MDEKIEFMEGFFVEKADLKTWIGILKKNPERANSLYPDLTKQLVEYLHNNPKLLTYGILNLPKLFADELIKIKEEDEIIQIEMLEFNIKCLREYIFDYKFNLNEYSIDIEQVRPQLMKFLGKYEQYLSELTAKPIRTIEENNAHNFTAENSYTSKVPVNEVPTTSEIIVSLSRISKAVYHCGLFEKHTKPKDIAEWIYKYCKVLKYNGTTADIESITRQISNVRSDDLRRGNKSKLQIEIEILKHLPEFY